MPDSTPAPAPGSSAPSPKRPRGIHDKIIGAYLTDAKKFLKVASEDPAERAAAYEALKTFMKELKGTARGALRGKPGLLAKLEM